MTAYEVANNKQLRTKELYKTIASANPASEKPTTMKPTLGLTGLTINAMALIAPGAFL